MMMRMRLLVQSKKQVEKEEEEEEERIASRPAWVRSSTTSTYGFTLRQAVEAEQGVDESMMPKGVAFTAATEAQVNGMVAWAASAVAELEQEAEPQPPAVVVQPAAEPPFVPLYGADSLASPVAFEPAVIARREALRNGPRVAAWTHVGESHSVSPTSVVS